MASPRVSRPADSRSREAACLASRAVLRSGPITTMVTSRARLVTAAAADRAASGSTLRYRIRSSTPRLANGPASARLAHASRPGPSAPGVVVGSPTPTSMLAPPDGGRPLVRPAGSWYGSGMRAGVILLVVAPVLAGSVGLLLAFQRRLISLPSPGPVPPAASFLPGAEDVSFETADGLRLQGWFVPPTPVATPVDNQTPHSAASVTLPEGAPTPAGRGEGRPGRGEGWGGGRGCKGNVGGRG